MKESVEKFIREYNREQHFYDQVARKCADQCETMLRAEGIRAIVTSRAKRPESLLDKLLARDVEKDYKTSDDIRGDLVDLAGVRIAVYFPRDRERLGKIIGDYFEVIKVKTFPIDNSDEDSRDEDLNEPKDEIYEKVFSGYHAQHYLVQLRKNTLPPESENLCSGVVEIQAASVLMHAWSEVEHDLVYKPKSGTLTKNELSILDEVNGLILSGEIALGRLQEAGEDRIRMQGRPFGNQYELAIFLIDLHKKRYKTDDEPSVGSIDVLLKILQEAKGDKPEFVEQLYGKVDYKDRGQTLSEPLIDALKAENPEQFTRYANKLGIDEAVVHPPARTPNYRATFLVRTSQVRSALFGRSTQPNKDFLVSIGVNLDDLKSIMRVFESIRRGEQVDADFANLTEVAENILSRVRRRPRLARSVASGRHVRRKPSE